MKTFIIAEAGVNHNGNLKLAKKMIDIAKASGADAVKFQAYIAEKLTSKFAPKAKYQKKSTGTKESQLEMLKKLQLNKSGQQTLIRYCKQKKIIFLSTPFDLESVDFLDKMGLKIIKIPSGEITNLPYLRKIGSLNKKLILSTGMATIKEIQKAVSILVISGTPKNKITVLHCNTAYPTPFQDANLRAIQSIKDKLKINVGYSDHTPGIEAPIAAVALGASVIEKHFTLSRKMKGPDHNASIEPKEFKAMVKSIRIVEKMLGTGIKEPSQSEIENISIVRKSIVAQKPIKKGEKFTENNITTKRPGTGINPMKWDYVLGKRAKKTFGEDELITI